MMGFADLSIQELATDYQVGVEQVIYLCDQLGITYKSPATRLPLEDAKAIILRLTSSNNENNEKVDSQIDKLLDRKTSS